MPSINLVQASYKLGKKLESLSAANTNFELLSMARAIDLFEFTPYSTVSALGNLPSASGKAGQVYFVESEAEFYYSTGSSWALFTQGQKAWTWGNNTFGQLANNTTASRSSPGTTAGGGNSWSRLQLGFSSGAGIKKNGTLWIWGDNTYGQLGTSNKFTRLSPVTPSGGGTTWCHVDLSACDGFTASAVKTDGTLWLWGRNTSGQLGDNTSIDKSSPITVAGGGTNWCYSSAGTCHSAAVKTDGTLWTWGVGSSGRLGTGNLITRSSPTTVAGGLTLWCKVCAGKDFTGAVRTNGTLYMWGSATCGKLGDNSTTNKSSPVTTAGGGTTWCNLSLGDDHTIAIRTDGSIWTWGRNTCGQLGVGTTINRSSPGTVAGGGTTWCGVAAGFAHAGAVKTDGRMWTWGSNVNGQLGSGDTINRSSPGTVVGSTVNWLTVTMGFNSTGGTQSF